LTQTDRKEFSNTDSKTFEQTSKIGAEFKIGYEESSGVATLAVSSESSFTHSYASSWTATSSRETQDAYEKSLTTTEQIAEGASVTRQVMGARLQAVVFLKNVGDIAFTIRNLQLTALIQDPEDATRLIPIATLLPDAEPASGFNLGPLVPERGPIIFSNDQIFPQLVESLMSNPRGLIFRFSNYDLTDELGRNFAFTSQDVNDRTAAVVIDFGGSDSDGDGEGDFSEINRVAVGTGRRAVDTNNDGVIDQNDRPVVFDLLGKSVGITLRDALLSMGLTEYDTPDTSFLTQEEIDNSYAVSGIGTDGSQQLFRIRRTSIDPALPQRWVVLTRTGAVWGQPLDNFILFAGDSLTLAFVTDRDGDRVPEVLEFLNGCSDLNRDSDGDGLDDRFELLAGWEVSTERSIRQVYSRCATPDSDGDGLSDLTEAPAVLTLDPVTGLILSDTNNKPRRDTSTTTDPFLATFADPITDPTNRDTDRDGLEDKFELDGYIVALRSPPNPPGTTVLVQTSPEFFDSDGDTAGDGLETRLGGNPRVSDFNTFGDADGDGVVNVVETTGWDVTVRLDSLSPDQCSEVCDEGQALTYHVTSDPLKRDTDGDGLSDFQEFSLGTNPSPAVLPGLTTTLGIIGRDTDGDGLTDFQEVFGVTLPGFGLVLTDPRDFDTDNDKE
ncbi:MAG: binary toxin-like calcium binding domain-containing protein, partial [bacterium]